MDDTENTLKNDVVQRFYHFGTQIGTSFSMMGHGRDECDQSLYVLMAIDFYGSMEVNITRFFWGCVIYGSIHLSSLLI